MPQITANIKTDEAVRQARKIAIDKGVSLREWAGTVIESEIQKKQSTPKTKRK